jgi:type IV secretory pathway VirB10-like protein
VKPRERHSASTRKDRLLSCECGASSGEFAFAIMVLAIAIVVGGLGGVWIAKREGMQKPKPSEPPQVTEQPSEQPSKQPEAEKPAGAPSKVPSPEPPEAKPQAPVPEARPAGPRLPSVDAIRYSSRAGTTEVTIELGAISLVKAAGLSNPERVYFDFQPGDKAANARGRLDSQNALDVSNDSLLAGIRVARWKSGDIRVVFDLRRACDFSYKVVPEPASRLIVELKAR